MAPLQCTGFRLKPHSRDHLWSWGWETLAEAELRADWSSCPVHRKMAFWKACCWAKHQTIVSKIHVHWLRGFLLNLSTLCLSPSSPSPPEAAAGEAKEASVVRGDQYPGEMSPVHSGGAGLMDLDGDLTCEMVLKMLNEWGVLVIPTRVRSAWRPLWNNEISDTDSHSFFQSCTQYLELFACVSLNVYKIKTKKHGRYFIRGQHLELRDKIPNPWIHSLDFGESGPGLVSNEFWTMPVSVVAQAMECSGQQPKLENVPVLVLVLQFLNIKY